MTQTEWIISLDDDLKDNDELFVGNVRDGEQLIRCKDCVKAHICIMYRSDKDPYGFCRWAARKEK